MTPTPSQPITFCPGCDTLLSPDVDPCPACGQPRPAEEAISPAWPPVPLEGRPAAVPLRLGETLLIAANRPDAYGLPRQGVLHRLTLAAGHRLPPWTLPEGQIITGAKPVRFLKPDRFGLLVTTASADPVGSHGAVLAFDGEGRELWRWQPGLRAVSAPAIANDAVWVTTSGRYLAGLSLADGGLIAEIPLDVPDNQLPGQAAPAMGNGFAYVACGPAGLLAVGLAGQPSWRYAPADSAVSHPPLCVGELVLAVVDGSGQVVALEAATGQVVWGPLAPGPASGRQLSPSAADTERLYVGGRKGITALRLSDGQPVWQFATKRSIQAGPVAAAGVLYAAGHDRQLYALEAGTGRLLWQAKAAVERVEQAAPLILTEPPLAVVVDRKGRVTALALPPSPSQQEAAGRWLEAADGYAGQGRLARAAALYEQHGKPYRAAQLWVVLGQPLAQAAALAQHAQSLPPAEAAPVWTEAGRLYKVGDQVEQAAACQLEVARCLNLPLLKIEVQTEDDQTLLHQGWSKLGLVVRNQGFGPAQTVSVRVTEKERFEGLVTRTRQLAQVPAGGRQAWTVDVRPLEFGDSVPLRLSLAYRDAQGQNYTNQLTLYLAVARDRAGQQPVQQVTVQVGGVHISNVVNSQLELGDITASVQAGGDIVAGDVEA